ncbi:RNA exonuclease 4 [Cimex lectularius]|uniref:RNA exonuclease 4 n=1 Tax=Cimex lectularius TaxID=79782 RepID=A0A8I6RB45_CIMLE|nr:RNA exonuclease 4 [Cimex lectularius]
MVSWFATRFRNWCLKFLPNWESADSFSVWLFLKLLELVNTCFAVVEGSMEKFDPKGKKRKIDNSKKVPGVKGAKLIKLKPNGYEKQIGYVRKTHDNLNTKFDKGIKNLADVNSKNCTGANNWERFIGKKIESRKTATNSSNNNRVNSDIKSDKPKTFNNRMKLTNVIGMDCEMVGIGKDGKDSILARVSLVNLDGDCLYDKFVKPRETVTDYRTHVSGVRKGDLENAESFEVVQRDVAELIRGRILVGHGLQNDMEVLYLSHPRRDIRDTSVFFRKRGRGTPSLKSLALEYLDVKIQEGEHSSVQDARAAVQLYNMFRKQWEIKGGNRKNARIDSHFERTNMPRYTQDIAQDT